MEQRRCWTQVSIMNNIESLLRAVCTVFSKSSVRRKDFEELVNATECEALSYRPLNEVRRL
jgi:hypothetical protein